MPEIPEQLKWYTPLNIGSGALDMAWRVSIGETGYIEIKRALLFRFSGVLVGIVIGVICTGILFPVYAFDLEGDGKEPFLIGVMVLTLPFTIFLFVALDAFCTLENSKYWKGSLRFRFNPQNGELFFSRENVTYGAGDYAKLVLGCVRGTEVMEAEDFRMFGLRVWRTVGKRARVRSTQIFMLVLNQNSEWQRYNLADDYNSDSNKWKTSELGNKQFLQLADLLQQHLSFETFVKDYSLDECYEQQR